MGPIQEILQGVKAIAKTLPSEFKGIVWAADEHIDDDKGKPVEYTRP